MTETTHILQRILVDKGRVREYTIRSRKYIQ